jgi:hypothetical protein
MNHAESPPSELEQLTVGEIRRALARSTVSDTVPKL